MLLFIIATIIGIVKKQKLPYWLAMLGGVALQFTTSFVEQNIIQNLLEKLSSDAALIGGVFAFLSVVVLGWIIPVLMLLKTYNLTSPADLWGQFPFNALLMFGGVLFLGLSFWVSLWILQHAGLVVSVSLGLGLIAAIISTVSKSLDSRRKSASHFEAIQAERIKITKKTT